LFWPVEADRVFGIVDVVVVGVSGADMKRGRNMVVVAVGNMHSGSVELLECMDSHIDLAEEEVSVVEEDI
jgi:hypothetical protein